MNTSPSRSSVHHAPFRAGAPGAQSGIALVVALLLLVIISLVGLAAVRGTIMQQKMASNMYDRSLQFQAAEAAMRAAADLIPNNPGIVARNCAAGGVICLANPFTDPNVPASAYQTVAAGTAAGQFDPSKLTGNPQFIVENMGNWADPTSDTGYSQSANAHNYGAQGVSTTAVYYRVTARSGDPAIVGNRAVVTLQAMIKRS